MYKYCANVEVEYAVDICSDFLFQVVIKEKMKFKIADCYFEVNKNHDCRCSDSDSLFVTCYLEREDIDESKKRIKHAIELFIFLTGIPFDVNSYVHEAGKGEIPIINMSISKRKMMKIDEINKLYNRVRRKKSLLENVLHMYAIATKEDNLLLENKEDAYFSYFKIIEAIVKDDFEIEKNNIEKNNIEKGKEQTKQYIHQMLEQVYGVRTNEDKLEELSGNISKKLFQEVFNEIYHKIIWFLQRHKISYNENKVNTMVSLRNKIAHGRVVHMDDYLDEYSMVIDMARKVIEAKFFGKSICIESRKKFI